MAATSRDVVEDDWHDLAGRSQVKRIGRAPVTISRALCCKVMNHQNYRNRTKTPTKFSRLQLPLTSPLLLILLLALPLIAMLASPAQSSPHGDKQSIFSPDKKYEVSHSQGKVYVRDSQNKLISEFTPKDSAGPNTGITDLYWIDNNRLGIQLHMNPSMDYLSLTDIHGQELRSYLGYNFSWSHNKKAVAHVGHMIHFTEWPHSEYIQINDRTVYPLSGPAYGKGIKAVHSFVPTFAWSPDDTNLALIDEVEGQGAGKYLVIVPINSHKPARQIKILPKQSAAIDTLYPNGVKLTWHGNTALTVSTTDGAKCKDLPLTISVTAPKH